MTTPYLFQRGETIALGLDVVEGEAGGASVLAARFKAVLPGGFLAEAPAADFAVAAREDGWTLSIDADASAALAPGLYRADARIAAAGGVIVTEPVDLMIVEPVTLPDAAP